MMGDDRAMNKMYDDGVMIDQNRAIDENRAMDENHRPVDDRRGWRKDG